MPDVARQHPARDAERLGTPPDLIRLSIGFEDPDDLIADLEQALDLTVANMGDGNLITLDRLIRIPEGVAGRRGGAT